MYQQHAEAPTNSTQPAAALDNIEQHHKQQLQGPPLGSIAGKRSVMLQL